MLSSRFVDLSAASFAGLWEVIAAWAVTSMSDLRSDDEADWMLCGITCTPQQDAAERTTIGAIELTRQFVVEGVSGREHGVEATFVCSHEGWNRIFTALEGEVLDVRIWGYGGASGREWVAQVENSAVFQTVLLEHQTSVRTFETSL